MSKVCQRVSCINPKKTACIKFYKKLHRYVPNLSLNEELLVSKQEIVFKKDKATLHVISKRCEDSKLFQFN